MIAVTITPAPGAGAVTDTPGGALEEAPGEAEIRAAGFAPPPTTGPIRPTIH